MKEPKLFSPEEIKNWDIFRLQKQPNQHLLCRGLRMTRLRLVYRLKMAFGVFKGRYDVLKWEAE